MTGLKLLFVLVLCLISFSDSRQINRQFGSRQSRRIDQVRGRGSPQVSPGFPRRRQPTVSERRDSSVDQGVSLSRPLSLQDNRWDPIGLSLANKKPVILKKSVYPKKNLQYSKQNQQERRLVFKPTTDISRIDTINTRQLPPTRWNNQAFQFHKQQFAQQVQQQLQKQHQQHFVQPRLQQQQQQPPQLLQQQQQQQQLPQFSSQPLNGIQIVAPDQRSPKTELSSPQRGPLTDLGPYEEVDGHKVYMFQGVDGRGSYDQSKPRVYDGTAPLGNVKWSQAKTFAPSVDLSTKPNIYSTEVYSGTSTPLPPFPTRHTSPQPKYAPVIIIAQSNVEHN